MEQQKRGLATAFAVCMLFGCANGHTSTEYAGDCAGVRGTPVYVNTKEGESPNGTLIGRPTHPGSVNRYLQGADPFVFRDWSAKSYLFTTNRPKTNVPVYETQGGDEWKFLGDALPNLPTWARRGFTWAPEVIRLGEDRYALWYTARDKTSGKQCVGRALSTRPEGPYADHSERPFICDEDRDSTIDASPYRDSDGRLYVLWKTKEMVQGAEKTAIWIGPLDPDGNLLSKRIKLLLTNDEKWEGKHVEAPTLLKRQKEYYLFYSAGASTMRGYLVSYATSKYLEGPYKKSGEILLGGNKCLQGAGHQSIVETGPSEYVIYFHAVHPTRRENRTDVSRFIDYAYLCFPAGKPTVQDTRCSMRR